MKFVQTRLSGAWTIELDRIDDERGWFARTFDIDEMTRMGLELEVVQCSASFSTSRGTLRGMHYQAEPHGEPKLVRCVRGAAFHVGVDLRPGSPTYRDWHGIELNADNDRAIYLPRGVAHGFQTLVDNCEVQYQMGERYVPEAARGLRWDDSTFGIRWPPVPDGGVRILSDRDRSFADWRVAEHRGSLANSRR